MYKRQAGYQYHTAVPYHSSVFVKIFQEFSYFFEQSLSNAKKFGILNPEYLQDWKGVVRNMALGFPLYIDLNGNNCVVFGGGDYACLLYTSRCV